MENKTLNHHIHKFKKKKSEKLKKLENFDVETRKNGENIVENWQREG